MIYPVPFEAGHLASMKLQRAQAWLHMQLRDPALITLEGPRAHTLMSDGEPIACGGAMEFHPNCARVWSFISAGVNVWNFRTVDRYARTFIGLLPYRRLEATTDAGFAAGRRWLESMGFVAEGLMKAFDINGRDHILYAKVA